MRMSLRKMQVFSPHKPRPEFLINRSELVNELNTLICIAELQSLETEGIDVTLALNRIQSMLGIKMSEAAASKLSSGTLLDESDLIEIVPRVRYTSTVPYSEGVAY